MYMNYKRMSAGMARVLLVLVGSESREMVGVEEEIGTGWMFGDGRR